MTVAQTHTTVEFSGITNFKTENPMDEGLMDNEVLLSYIASEKSIRYPSITKRGSILSWPYPIVAISDEHSRSKQNLINIIDKCTQARTQP